MILQFQPNRWSCLATSFAMALDIPVAQFFDLVGHDGSEILYPELPEPVCRRGIHVQEAIEVAWTLGYSSTPFELFPQSRTSPGGPTHVVKFPTGNWDRFSSQIGCRKGVIECVTQIGNGHAVAFLENVIYDPASPILYPWSRDAMEQRGLITRSLWCLEARAEQTQESRRSAVA